MAPDLDDICAEQLAHLGPVALETVRLLINRSWENGQVPSSWRSAIIIPIPKASKNPKATESYCPISLTSHLAKLAERLVAARLTVLADQTGLPPPPPRAGWLPARPRRGRKPRPADPDGSGRLEPAQAQGSARRWKDRRQIRPTGLRLQPRL